VETLVADKGQGLDTERWHYWERWLRGLCGDLGDRRLKAETRREGMNAAGVVQRLLEGDVT